jgi:hypothetical protein
MPITIPVVMPGLILADVGLGPIAQNPGVSLVTFVGLLALIVVSEGLVLWAFRSASLGRSLLRALVMNIASGLVGIVLVILAILMPFLFIVLSFGSVVGLLFMWGVSVAIEALILIWLKWTPARKAWISSAIANAVSYLLLILVPLGLIWLR